MNIVVDQDYTANETVWRIIEKYPNIISPHCKPNVAKPNIFHRIVTGNNSPTFFKPLQLLAHKFDIVKEEFR